MAGLGITIAFHSSRKWVARGEKDNGIDRLLDDILCNIVSKLRLIEASWTSILSRRWRNIWTMKNELVFTYLSTFGILKKYHIQVADGDKQRFFKAVDQCLQLYSNRDRKLQVFSLQCCFLKDDTYHLVQWMQTLSRLDAEFLYLGHSCGLSRLKYLGLTSCYVETSFVGQCISLGRKDISRLRLLSHQLPDILMSCPNLRHLSMRCCELPQNLRISGPNLKLEYLSLLDCYNVKKIEISGINVITVLIDTRSEK